MGPIERGRKYKKRTGRPLGPIAQRMHTMKKGESFMLDTWGENTVARGWQQRLRPQKKFSIQKVPHEGWRVWRLE